MSFRLFGAAASACLILAGVAGAAVPAAGQSVSDATVDTANDVRVGSFNISSVTFDTSAGGDHRVWRDRRARVAGQILAQKLDVVGVQEANPSRTYASRMVRGVNQYMDLKDALNVAGGHYALTNEYAYNCVNPSSTYKCVYQNRGAALDNRIFYDTDTVSLVKQGSYRFPTQTAGKYERYLIWAVLKMKATGRQFLFTNTHLDPYSSATRVAQWKQAVVRTNALKGALPVVAVGDYNTTKYSTWAAQMLPLMKSNGYGDVLNQEFQVNPVRVPRAASTVNAWINSYNGFRRDVTTGCYCTRRDKLGNNIDWIFAGNGLPVRQWEVVVDMDPSTLRLRGTIPSDHNLVRATISLP